MPFINIPGLTGKIYVPESEDPQPRKHHCRDCFSCQMCSDDRCHVCLKHKNCSTGCLCRENREKHDADTDI